MSMYFNVLTGKRKKHYSSDSSSSGGEISDLVQKLADKVGGTALTFFNVLKERV